MGYSFILLSYRPVYELEIGTLNVRMPSGQNYHFCGVLMGCESCEMTPEDVKCSHMTVNYQYITMNIVINVDIETVIVPLIYIFFV